MQKEVKKTVIQKFATFRITKVAFCIAYIILFSLNSMIYDWSQFFYYPEEQYQRLEQEAKRINDKQELRTDYHYRVTNYDSQTNNLTVDLMDGDIFVTVEILAYQSDYAVFLTKRNETKTIRAVKNGLELLLIPIIPAVGLVAIYLLVLVIIAFTFRILEKIKKCFK